jgi:hypothetical protein
MLKKYFLVLQEKKFLKTYLNKSLFFIFYFIKFYYFNRVLIDNIVLKTITKFDLIFTGEDKKIFTNFVKKFVVNNFARLSFDFRKKNNIILNNNLPIKEKKKLNAGNQSRCRGKFIGSKSGLQIGGSENYSAFLLFINSKKTISSIETIPINQEFKDQTKLIFDSEE